MRSPPISSGGFPKRAAVLSEQSGSRLSAHLGVDPRRSPRYPGNAPCWPAIDGRSERHEGAANLRKGLPQARPGLTLTTLAPEQGLAPERRGRLQCPGATQDNRRAHGPSSKRWSPSCPPHVTETGPRSRMHSPACPGSVLPETSRPAMRAAAAGARAVDDRPQPVADGRDAFRLHLHDVLGRRRAAR